MQPNIFPQDYNRQVDEETSRKIEQARQRSNSRYLSIERHRQSKPEGNAWGWGAGIGFFLGFFVCVFVCFIGDAWEASTFGSGIFTWMVVILISAIIGVVIDLSAESSYKKNVMEVDYYLGENSKSFGEEEKNIKEIATREKATYYSLFEKSAQDMSVQFAESELAKEVIEWMTNGFCNIIDAVDRRSHVALIQAPFMFKVFYNKITCNLGTFDFEIKRCRNLNSPLEQAALARAIVSAIQLNIIMKYPKDVTGTEISIKISYSYSNNCVETYITYVAPNGNYKEVRSW